MSHTLTIAKRELSSLFYSPVAYLVLMVFAFIAAGLFVSYFQPGVPAQMQAQFGALLWLLVFLLPALSMGLVSDELARGTIEPLMTAPVSDTQVVLGKWLGAMGFFLALLVPVLVEVLVLELTADPDYGPILTGLLGLILTGGLFLAIGVMLSAVTSSQLVAFLLTVLATGLLTIGTWMITRADWPPDWLVQTLWYVNINEQFANFARGVVDLRNLVYFLSTTALCLFLAVKLLESRRWR